MSAAVVAGVALIGFLHGTSEADYDLRHPSQTWLAGSDAPTYNTMRHEEYEGDIAKTCVDCHEGRQDYLPSRTEHPVGVELPKSAQLEELLEAGGLFIVEGEGDDQTLSVQCRTCHRPHDATRDARLVVSVEDSVLCLSCHQDHSPRRGSHPTVVDGCLQCHDPHEATSGNLLRTHGEGERACRECHSDQATGLGSHGHKDQTCTDCHGMHTAIPKMAKARAAGLSPCAACHDEELVHQPHEEETCGACHSTHSQTPALLTKGAADPTCLECHEEQQAVASGGHKGECAKCHGPHEPSPRASGHNPASASCMSCHEEDVPAYSHPTDLLLTASGQQIKGESPYFSPSGARTRGVGELTCQTCHDQHSGAQDLLIPGVQPWCTTCHGDETEDRYVDYHDETRREQAYE